MICRLKRAVHRLLAVMALEIDGRLHGPMLNQPHCGNLQGQCRGGMAIRITQFQPSLNGALVTNAVCRHHVGKRGSGGKRQVQVAGVDVDGFAAFMDL